MKTLHKLMLALLVLAIALIGISGIPAFRNADHGVKYVIGAIGWFGGLVCALVLIVLAIVSLVRAGTARRAPA